MAAVKYQPFERVEVIWLDAYTTYAPSNHTDFAKYVPCRRYTIGYLLYHDAERVTVSTTDDRQSAVTTNNVEEVTTIPIGMVEKIVRLKPVS